MIIKHLLDTPVGNVELTVSCRNLELRAKPKLSMWDSLAHGGVCHHETWCAHPGMSVAGKEGPQDQDRTLGTLGR